MNGVSVPAVIKSPSTLAVSSLRAVFTGVASGEIDVLPPPGNPGGTGAVEIRSRVKGRKTGLEPVTDGGLGLRLMLRGVATPESIIPVGNEEAAGEITLISSSKILERLALAESSTFEFTEGESVSAETAEASTDGTDESTDSCVWAREI